jgi:rRNA maturation endonuclease Nob1
MSDYISREAAIEQFRKSLDGGYVLTDDAQTTYILQSIPAADVRPVVRGKWQFHMFTANSWGYECRVCHTTWDAPANFCPNCGAMMEES